MSRPLVGFASALVVALACPTVFAADAIALPADQTGSFADRTPIDAGPTADALRTVAGFDAQAVARAAERHFADRRAEVTKAVGEPAVDLSVWRDLVRYPRANAGAAVTVSGLVTGVERIEVQDVPAILLRVRPADSPEGTFAVLLPEGAAAPEPGGRIEVSGLFLKLAQLEGPEPTTAPLLVAPSVRELGGSGGLLPDKSLWKTVHDKTRGVRLSERDAYYRLLGQAREADPAALREAAAAFRDERAAARPQPGTKGEFPVFVDLFRHPEAYRGQAVTLTGYAREVRKYPAGPNSEGLQTLYEIWMYTEDSQTNPAVVVASSAPESLPIGEDVQVPVRATGYFFKMYGYQAQDTTRIAPMILASGIDVLLEPRPAAPTPWLAAVIGAFLVGLAAYAVWAWRQRPRRPRGEAGTPDFGQIEPIGEPPA